MEKQMPDYLKAKIYTIRNKNDDSLIYVGATVQSLSARFGGHKHHNTSIKHYVNTTFNGDWSSWYIELYENYPCSSKEELDKREGEIIRKIGTINKAVMLGCSKKEIKKNDYIKHKDKNLERQSNYRKNNIEKIQNYFEINRETLNEKKREKIACVCGCEISRSGKARHEKTKIHQNFVKSASD